jgi:hypothetical protein
MNLFRRFLTGVFQSLEYVLKPVIAFDKTYVWHSHSPEKLVE